MIVGTLLEDLGIMSYIDIERRTFKKGKGGKNIFKLNFTVKLTELLATTEGNEKGFMICEIRSPMLDRVG